MSFWEIRITTDMSPLVFTSESSNLLCMYFSLIGSIVSVGDSWSLKKMPLSILPDPADDFAAVDMDHFVFFYFPFGESSFCIGWRFWARSKLGLDSFGERLKLLSKSNESYSLFELVSTSSICIFGYGVASFELLRFYANLFFNMDAPCRLYEFSKSFSSTTLSCLI